MPNLVFITVQVHTYLYLLLVNLKCFDLFPLNFTGISSSNIATLGVGIIQVIATAVATWLVDKTGRRILLIVR